jgi:hypothetical protein
MALSCAPRLTCRILSVTKDDTDLQREFIRFSRFTDRHGSGVTLLKISQSGWLQALSLAKTQLKRPVKFMAVHDEFVLEVK